LAAWLAVTVLEKPMSCPLFTLAGLVVAALTVKLGDVAAADEMLKHVVRTARQEAYNHRIRLNSGNQDDRFWIKGFAARGGPDGHLACHISRH